MTRIKFNLKKSYGVLGGHSFSDSHTLIKKKKSDSLYCLARKTPFDRGWVCKIKRKKRLKEKNVAL